MFNAKCSSIYLKSSQCSAMYHQCIFLTVVLDFRNWQCLTMFKILMKYNDLLWGEAEVKDAAWSTPTMSNFFSSNVRHHNVQQCSECSTMGWRDARCAVTMTPWLGDIPPTPPSYHKCTSVECTLCRGSRSIQHTRCHIYVNVGSLDNLSIVWLDTLQYNAGPCTLRQMTLWPWILWGGKRGREGGGLTARALRSPLYTAARNWGACLRGLIVKTFQQRVGNWSCFQPFPPLLNPPQQHSISTEEHWGGVMEN